MSAASPLVARRILITRCFLGRSLGRSLGRFPCAPLWRPKSQRGRGEAAVNGDRGIPAFGPAGRGAGGGVGGGGAFNGRLRPPRGLFFSAGGRPRGFGGGGRRSSPPPAGGPCARRAPPRAAGPRPALGPGGSGSPPPPRPT